MFGVLGWIGAAEAEPLSQVPISPGAYLIDGKAEGFCRHGPGGKSLIVETAEAMAVITIVDAKVHVDRFA